MWMCCVPGGRSPWYLLCPLWPVPGPGGCSECKVLPNDHSSDQAILQLLVASCSFTFLFCCLGGMSSNCTGHIVGKGLITSDSLSFVCVYCCVKPLMYSTGAAGVSIMRPFTRLNWLMIVFPLMHNAALSNSPVFICVCLWARVFTVSNLPAFK